MIFRVVKVKTTIHTIFIYGINFYKTFIKIYSISKNGMNSCFDFGNPGFIHLCKLV